MAGAHLGPALREIHRLFQAGTVAGFTDGQLIEQFLSTRDEEAFAALVGRHGPMVLSVCRSVLNDSPEVEDAFQATFLVLIRRAGTIWCRDALGGWLHRVAHRVAVRASLDRSRKNSVLRQVDDLSALVACELDPPADDWRATLHEEVARLPEKLRLPVVLCYLEGKTHAQAACELRWGEATVRRRLAGARDLLRARLTRRGVALTSAGLSAALAREASAAVPTGWIEELTRLAGRLATGDAAVAGAVSAAAARLAEALVRSLVVDRIRMVASLATVLVAAGLVAPILAPAGPAMPEPAARVRSDQGLDASPQAPTSPPSQPASARDPDRRLTVHGRVLDPDGKPLPKAKIYSYLPMSPRDDPFAAGPPVPCAISDAAGRFQCRIGEPRLQTLEAPAQRDNATVVALARGFGPAWASITEIDEAKELTLRLVRDDVPIVGRLLDLEGRPISGVTVRPVQLSAYSQEDLSAWEAGMARAKDIDSNEAIRLPSRGLELFRWREELSVTTGADGRFRLTGIGRERVVSFWIEGPTIVTSCASVHARTRPGPTYRLPIRQDKPEYGSLVFHGATFDDVEAPTRPIEGTVRDKDTGKPLAGISICSDRFAGNEIGGRGFVRATTGRDGRYRLVGMPGGPGNMIAAYPGPGQPYLTTSAQVPAGTAPHPATVDFALNRGVAIRGKVVDKATGHSVQAVVEYFLFGDNPHRGLAGHLHEREISTGPDGSFELIGLPGHGLVAARAAQDHYLVGTGAAAIPGADEHGWFHTDPRTCQPEFFHAMMAIDPAEGADSLTCDLALDPGVSRAGTVLDPSGKPLAGCVAVNLCPATMSGHIDTLPSEAFTARALDPKQARPVFFRHHEKKLAAVVMARGDESGPLTVRLQPAGTLIGRLLDEEGRPSTRPVLSVSYGPDQFAFPYYFTLLDPTLGGDGRFRIEGLIPGVVYNVDCRVGSELFVGEFAKGIVLQRGETRDLGDVKVRPK
jgi:RNA polymerase sigma factor (sigma-70 family)